MQLIPDGDMVNSGISEIYTGYETSCALKDGSLYCWGLLAGVVSSTLMLQAY